MSIVILVAFLVVGISFVAMYAKAGQVSLGQFVRQSYKQLLGLSTLLVPAVVLLSACKLG